MESPKKKSLPSISEMKQKGGHKKVTNYLRNNPEVSEWIIEMFTWKDSGDIHTSHQDIAEELSDYSGLLITGDHISRAFRKWKKNGKF